MKKAFICLSIVAGMGLSSCQRQALSRNPSQAKDELCDSLRLLDDLELSGTYLKRWLDCLADSKEKLTETKRFSESFGNEGFNDLVDLLKTPNMSQGYPLNFPLLSALTTLIDRGTTQLSGLELFSENERFENTQPSLQKFNFKLFLRQLTQLENKGLLPETIDYLLKIQENLPESFSADLIRRILTDERTQEQLSAFNELLLKEPELVSAITDLLFSQSSDSQSKSASNAWLEFWDSLDAAQRRKVSSSISFLLQEIAQSQEDKLTATGIHLSSALRDLSLSSTHIVDDLALTLSPLTSLELSDFEPIVEGLEKIIENPSYIDTVQEKAGAAKLEKYLAELLWFGGSVKACNNLVLEPMFAQTPLQQADRLRFALSPQPSCSGLSPISAAASSELELPIAESQQIGFDRNPPSTRDWQTFLNYSFASLRHELAIDPFFLFHSAMAYDAVSPEDIEKIERLSPRNFSVEEFIEWDDRWKGLPELNTKLHPDFLELWLGEVIFRLEASSYQLDELFPSGSFENWLRKHEPETTQRTFLGFYEGGPAKDLIREQARAFLVRARDFEDIPKKRQASWASRLFQSLSAINGLYKNPELSFQASQEGLALNFLGDLDSSQGFKNDGDLLSPAFQLDESIVSLDSDLLLKERIKRQLPLANEKQVELLTQEFLSFIEAPKEPIRNLDLAPRLPSSLFQASAYSTQEARLLAIFLGQQLFETTDYRELSTTELKVNPLPSSSNTLEKSRAPRRFSGAASTAEDSLSWPAYVKWMPTTLMAEDTSFENWLDSIREDEKSLLETFTNRANNPVRVGLNSLEKTNPELLSQHERLLTILNSVSFIFSGKAEQFLVPTIGFANYCPFKNENATWSKGSCPLTSVDYQAYLEWVENRLLSAICPLLVDSQESKSLQALLSLQTDELSTVCNYTATAKFPKGYASRIAEDILITGKNPRLKDGLSNLPLLIKEAKIARNDSANFSDWNRTRLARSPKLAAITLQREESYFLLRQSFPGILSSFALELSLQTSPQTLTEKLIKYSRGNGSQHLTSQTLSALTDSFRLSQSRGDSLVAFISRTSLLLANRPALLEGFSELIYAPYSPYTGILLGFTLAQAVEAEILPEFSTSQPAYSWLISSLHQERSRALAALLYVISEDVPAVVKASARIFSAFQDEKTIGKSAVKFFVEYITKRNQSIDLDASIRQLALAPQGAKLLKETISFTHTSLAKPLASLDNTWNPSWVQQLDAQQTEALVIDSVNLIRLIEQNEDISLLLSNLTETMTHQKNSDLFELLQDDRLGFRSPDLWKSILAKQDFQRKLSRLLRRVDQINSLDNTRLADEFEQLIDGSYKFLAFSAQKFKWQEDTKTDYKYFVDALGRLADSPYRREKTLELVRSYLDGTDSKD